MTSTIPHFGPTEAPLYNRVPFEFTYYRDEALETQKFNLLDKPLDIGAAHTLARRADGDDDGATFTAMLNLIAKYMDDKDGTGSRWRPVPMAAKPKEDPPVKRFRGPDGKPHEWSKADEFLLPERGSSRRRWRALMEDDEASVDQDALIKLLEFLIEVAGKDRTRA